MQFSVSLSLQNPEPCIDRKISLLLNFTRMPLVYYYPLDVTVISADKLRDVHLKSKMKAWVEVSLGGHDATREKTDADKNGGVNPRWNEQFNFPIDAKSIKSLDLVFDIKSKGTLGIKEVGRVRVPLKDLFDSNDAATEREVKYKVDGKSANTGGILRFSYRFGEKAVGTVTTGEASPAHVGASTAGVIGGGGVYVNRWRRVLCQSNSGR